MFESIQLVAIGAAAVIDAILLIALLERPNRRRVACWMWWMAGATLLFHAGSFTHQLLIHSTAPSVRVVDRLAMNAMALGLLLLPASMLHGCLRISRSGLQLRPAADWRYAVLYLPVLAMIPIAGQLARTEILEFTLSLDAFRRPYLVYFLAASVFASAKYYRLREHPEFAASRTFLGLLAGTFLTSGVLVAAGAWYGLDAFPEVSGVLILALTLAPVATVVLFLYFVLRYGLLQLLLERSLLYVGLLIILFLVHAVIFARLRDSASSRLGVNLAVVEGSVAVALILLYAPFRHRVSESLRYLASARVSDVRARCRELAVRMTDQLDQPVDVLLTRVLSDLETVFDVRHATVFLFEPQTLCVPDADPEKSAAARNLARQLRSRGVRSESIWSCEDRGRSEALDMLGAAHALLLDHADVFGILLLSTDSRRPRLPDEDLSALSLIVEQLAITLRLQRMQRDRLAAERRILQQEKLSTLGLLAGSLAHEVRNPLSSIRSITTVLAEDLGADSPYAEDLELVLGEIDRLADTTSQLLAFGRSDSTAGTAVRPAAILRQCLQLMRHVASAQQVELSSDLQETEATVRASRTSLQEVFFNLLQNSLDAAGPGGRVEIACLREQDSIVIRVADNGGGIAPEIQDRLFEPFATTKAQGTGLGLYIAAQHVREWGGEIHCETTAGSGTEFTVLLPIEEPQCNTSAS